MKKHRYKATNVKNLNWAKIAAQVASQPMVLGIDVAKDDFFAVLMKADRSVLETIKWVHPEQTRELGEHLCHDLPADRLEVVMEPSGTYGDALRRYLSELGFTMYRVAPKRVHDAAELYDGVPSLHDAKSAYLIGRLHLEGASQRWEELTESRRDHQALVAELELFQNQHQRHLNQLEAALNRHWPEVVRLLDLKRVSLLSLIAEYGEPRQVAAHWAEAQQLMRSTGRGFLTAQKIEQVLASSQESLGIACIEAERHFLQQLGRELLRTHQAVRAIERRIEHQVQADPVLMQMARVTGKTTSLVLAATQGTPLEYPDAHSYLKALGLNLKERSSGKHQGQLKITKRGAGRARKYLYLTALRWSYQDPLIGAWYRNKVKRDGQRKGKAIIAIMRKLALSLWYVARGEPFDSGKLFNARSLGLIT